MWNALVFYPGWNDKGLNHFREKYDPSYPAYPEHMPLLIVPSDLNQDLVDAHLRQILDRLEPFEIHFHGLFKSCDHWLLLGVEEGNKAIRELHDKIYSGILAPYRRRDLPFDPYIGLGLSAENHFNPFSPTQVGLKKKEYRKALREAEILNLDFRCTLKVLDYPQGTNDVQAAPVIIRKYFIV